MSRNSSGTYSLPAGNPVVTNTTISSSWANTTLSDIASAMTDSLSRSGKGGMQAALALDDGTIGNPGLTFTAELTTGFYRATTGDVRFAAGGGDILILNAVSSAWAATTIALSGTNLTWNGNSILTGASGANPTASVGVTAVNGSAGTFMRSDGAPALNQSISPTWTGIHTFTQYVTATGVISSSGPADPSFIARRSGDSPYILWEAIDGTDLAYMQAILSTGLMEIHNHISGGAIDLTTSGGGLVKVNGSEVGLRGMHNAATSGSYNFAASDGGRLIRYTGSGGHTFGINNGVFSGTEVITITNSGSGSLAISGTISSLSWYNGSGTITTGGRALAVGGVATIYLQTSSAAYIWGTGLT